VKESLAECGQLEHDSGNQDVNKRHGAAVVAKALPIRAHNRLSKCPEDAITESLYDVIANWVAKPICSFRRFLIF
jgi:hypothetical protein